MAVGQKRHELNALCTTQVVLRLELQGMHAASMMVLACVHHMGLQL
jgi:hypothetical protein